MTDSLPILLHAAARGARLQIYSWRTVGRSRVLARVWVTMDDYLPGINADGEYRIHPDDQHLRYGPISSALFEAGSTGEKIPGVKEHYLIEWYVPIIKGELPTWEIPESDRQWFLLMLAEELVWNGL